jgi:predicted neutral ceramidase superfamily lipid hydrolase
VIVVVAGVLFQWLTPQYASVAIPFIVVFFFLITLFTLYIVLRSQNKSSGKKFIVGYMLSRIIKMFSTLIFFILYILLNENDRWQFTGAFLVIYFLYSIFEIIALKKEQ